MTYSKEIKYDRETRDFAMYLDGELVGWAATSHDAEVALDKIVLERISRQTGAMPLMPEAQDSKANTARTRGTLVNSHSDGEHTVEVYVAAEMAHHSRDTLWHCFVVDGAYHGRFMGQQEAEAEFQRIVLGWLPAPQQAAERELLASRPADPEPQAVFVPVDYTCEVCGEMKGESAFSRNSGHFADMDVVACDACVADAERRNLEALLKMALEQWKESGSPTPYDPTLASLDRLLNPDPRFISAGHGIARQFVRDRERFLLTFKHATYGDQRAMADAFVAHASVSPGCIEALGGCPISADQVLRAWATMASEVA
jgi:hypothetical protein